MKNDSPINAKIIFKDGNKRIFYGNRYEKEDMGQMVLSLRKMTLKFLHNIHTVQFFDNTITKGNKVFFEYKNGVVLMNNMVNYLGNNFNPQI